MQFSATPLLSAFLALLISACLDDSPTGLTRADACTPAGAASLALAGAPIDLNDLSAAAADASTRAFAGLPEDDATLQLESALAQVGVHAVAGEREAACHAFNRAAALAPAIADSSAGSLSPDAGAIHLVLGLAHAWLSQPAQITNSGGQ